MTNRDLAQWCIKNNNMNKKQAEECILYDSQEFDKLRHLQWDFNELCIAYFLDTKPLFWEGLK